MKKFVQKWWKKALISLAIAVVLAVALEFLQVKTQPPYYEYREIAVNYSEAISTDAATLTSCVSENGILKTTGQEKADIIIPLQGTPEMNRIKMILDAPAEANAYILAYCFKNVEEDPAAAEALCLAGNSELNFWVPKDTYSQLELKVDGSLAIRTIQGEDVEAEKVFVPGSVLKGRMALVAVIIFIVSMILWAIHGWQRLRGCFRAAKQGILEDPRKTAVNALIFLGTGGIAWLILRLYLPTLLGKPFNFLLNAFSIFVAVAVGCLFCFRKTLGRKPEVFFVILCLLIGMNLTFFYPTNMVSWDEETHAANAMRYSYLGNTRITGQDELAMTPGQGYKTTLSYFDETIKEQNRLYNDGVIAWRSGLPESKNYWTFFSGIGLYLGRVLQLPFHWMWSLGRFFGLLAYTVVGYFAIRRLKSGKMILAAVLLIPTCVFLASTFSYDAGVTSLLALGISYLIREWQEPEKKIEWKNAFIMIGALFAGCYIKAIYFPLLLLPLFMKKEKFADKKQRQLFTGLTLAAMIALIATFVIPFIFSPWKGDTRGGEDVNTSSQVQFILSNPLEYTRILLEYLRSYLSLDTFQNFITFFAYVGFAPNHILYLLLLCVAAFTDREGTELDNSGGVRGRICMQVILFITMVLFTTSMYVAFTPVGATTVNGSQPRYLLPLFFPAIMLLCSGKVKNGMNKTVYNGLLFTGIAFVGFTAALMKCINLYV